MNITICGSIAFANEMKQIQKELEDQGHQVSIPQSVIEGKSKEYSSSLKKKDLTKFTEFVGERIKLHFNKIKESDAILVLNYDKDGKKNYIGPNTFLEMGFAFVYGKKIFTINQLPDDDKNDELISLKACCLKNDISLIK